MRNILVTGGAGFIGSHVVDGLVQKFPDANITILDKMTYAADFENLTDALVRGKRRLVVGDICDLVLCEDLTRDMDCVFHVAAESHVDNSFSNSLAFTHSNTLGTHTLLEAARRNKVPLFVHTSTDEVYGELHTGKSLETDRLNPSNPYSASKASAEMIVNSYYHSFNMPIITIRANNIFGTRQFPEKIIPKFSMQMLSDMKVTLHGGGMNSRHYLLVGDFVDALLLLAEKGAIGSVYNIGTVDEHTNLDVAKMICQQFGKSFENSVEYVEDRPFNDQRYSVDYSKLTALGWRPTRSLKDQLPEIIAWYRDNIHRYDNLFD
jgi:UDP-glucose 4,6-dehydratase